MIFQAARLSLINLFAAETRSVFWKVLGLTLLVLARALAGAAQCLYVVRLSVDCQLLSRDAGLGGVARLRVCDRCRHRACARVGAVAVTGNSADCRPVSRRCGRGGRKAGLSLGSARHSDAARSGARKLYQVSRCRHPWQYRRALPALRAGHQPDRVLPRQRLPARPGILRVCRDAVPFAAGGTVIPRQACGDGLSRGAGRLLPSWPSRSSIC